MLWVLLLSFVRQTIAAFSRGLVVFFVFFFSHYWSIYFILYQCSLNFEVFHFYYLEQAHYSRPYVSFKHCFLFSQACIVSSAHAPISTKLNLWRHSLNICKVLCASLASPLLCQEISKLLALFNLGSTWFLPVHKWT